MFGRGKSAEKSIYHHPLLGEVVLVCSWRARRVVISVRPSGEVRLTYPRMVGKARALEFLESRVEWVEQSRRRLAERAVHQPEYTPDQIEQMRREAKKVLPERVALLAERFGFKYGRVSIRASRSKWGSCSGENNISLSLFLMTLPEHLRDLYRIGKFITFIEIHAVRQLFLLQNPHRIGLLLFCQSAHFLNKDYSYTVYHKIILISMP